MTFIYAYFISHYLQFFGNQKIRLILRKSEVWCIKFLAVIAMLFIYIGETGCSVKTRKREHVNAVRNFDPEKSALCQQVLEHDHVIDRENVKILKSESHANRLRTAESFLINQKAKEFNVLNCNDGAILLEICSELDLTSAFEVRTRDGLVWFLEFILTTKRQRFLQNLANNNKFEQ